MSTLSAQNISRLSSAIDKIQFHIDHINEVTEQAITFLEAKKREIRRSAGSYPDSIQTDITNIALEHDRLIEKIVTKRTDVTLRKASVDQLDFAISELDREISRVQNERDSTVCDLEKKIEYIKSRLRSIEDLDILLGELTAQIYSTTHDFETEMAEAQQQREAILSATDLTESERALALAQLDKEIQEKQQMHDEYIDSLRRQIDESMVQLREANMDIETAVHLKENIRNQIDELEVRKIGATESEISELNRRINILKQQMDEVDLLRALNERGLRLSPSGHIVTGSGRILTVEEAQSAGLLDGMDISTLLAKEKLKERGLELTPSGNIHTASGQVITLAEAMHRGLMEGIDVGAIIDRDEGSGAPTVSTEGSILSGMASEDVEYLKTVVGKPLTLALAEICAKQPRDPIHYLGHWLFKYRYNQEVSDIQKKEIEELITERERIRLEKWHREVEDAARSAVLDMVFKAHDKAIQRELEEIARMQEMMEAENEELAEEAKDTLGELGPPLGQRMSLN